VEVEWLVDVMVGAELHRLDGGLDARKRGHHDDLRLGRGVLHPFEHREAVAVWQLEIEEYEVDFRRREPFERLGGESRLENVESGRGQPLAQRAAHQWLVLYEQARAAR